MPSRCGRFQALLVTVLLVEVVALWPTAAHAQSTTGTITGRVVDAQGLAAPGTTVVAVSPNLQGTRTAITSPTGSYILTLLPPGAYTVSFDLPGFARKETAAELAPAQTLTVDSMLDPSLVTQAVRVVGSSEVLTRTAQLAINFKQSFVFYLPTNRDIRASIQLAAVHATGPSGGLSIGGAPTFANLFLLNGVPIVDNLRGQAYDLYIEDALEQTTVATAGISAEFGRFSGGAVNVVTKSGGNRFSGSLRDTLVNDRWRTLTPFEDEIRAADPTHSDPRVDRTIPTYEYTFGGPAMKNRLWFFAAGRNQHVENTRTLVMTKLPYTFASHQQRYEGKLTWAVSTGHRLQGSVINSHERQTNQSYLNGNVELDETSLYITRRPLGLFSLEYNGILSPRLSVEARVSARNETLSGVGSPSTDRITGTLLIDRARNRYWAPTFCGVCGDEQRDGQDVFVKGSFFLSRPRVGSHSMSFGYDGYNDRRYANNHATGSDYRITGTTAIPTSSGVTAQFIADGTTAIVWSPIIVPTEGTNFRTHSGFYNDNWRISDRISASLGLRYDRNHAVDSSGVLVVRDGEWSPRAGLSVDLSGNQSWVVTANVAKYVEALANTIANAASPGGNPDTYQFTYGGPDINADTTGELISTADGIGLVLDWFRDNGGAALPLTFVNVAGVTPVIDPSLVPPSVWEYGGGIRRQLGERAALRADVTYRHFGDFYAVRTDISTGQVVDSRPSAPAAVRGRPYDRGVIENTDLLARQYAGLSLQGQYRPGARLDAGASYTLSRAWGNVDGETTNGPSGSNALQYPEYKQDGWAYPTGDLSIDQRHRARLWATYAPPWIPGLTLGGLQILESGVPYGAISTNLNFRPFVTPNPGYITPPAPGSTQYYFTARDAFRTEGQRRTDLAISYVHELKPLRGMEIFGQLQVLNVFNQSQLCACGALTALQDGGFVDSARIVQTISTPAPGQLNYQQFNPLTTSPVEGVDWAKAANFGQAQSSLAYTTPQTLRLTFGVRF